MIKALRIRKDEPLHNWVKRFCEYYHLSDEVADGVHEISIQSYIKGANNTLEVVGKSKKSE